MLNCYSIKLMNQSTGKPWTVDDSELYTLHISLVHSKSNIPSQFF